MFLTLFSASCMGQKVDNTPVGDLVIDRYLGDWYEIARFDHWFERGVSHAQARYGYTDDGYISVTNTGIKNGKVKCSEGRAKFTDTPGLLRVSFFRPFYSDYRILMVDEDCSFALVGSKTPSYLWILSRTPQLDESTTLDLLYEAVGRGYETDKLIWVEQTVP